MRWRSGWLPQPVRTCLKSGPAVPLHRRRLDWTNKNSRSSVEMSNPGSRPEIAQRLEGMDDYDTVFVGFPIWWYVAPSIVCTFLRAMTFPAKP